MSENKETAVVVQLTQQHQDQGGFSLPAMATMSDDEFSAMTRGAKLQVQRIAALYKEVMIEGVHYGVVPGTERPSLLQPGADLLMKMQRCVANYPEATLRRTLIPTPAGTAPLIVWDAVCEAHDQGTGEVRAVGSGSCNTHEPKYRYRWAQAKCPTCGREDSFMRSKNADEWFCWNRRGGCGSTFPTNDQRIQGALGKVENTDSWGLDNTCKKMAMKRAKVACANELSLASGIFAQDLEELAENGLLTPDAKPTAETETAAAPKRAAPKPAPKGRNQLGARKEATPAPAEAPPIGDAAPPVEAARISDEQRRLMFAKAKERALALGLDGPDDHHTLLTQLLATWSITTTRAVPASDLDSILDSLASFTPEGLAR